VVSCATMGAVLPVDVMVSVMGWDARPAVSALESWVLKVRGESSTTGLALEVRVSVEGAAETVRVT
jgi:hypothetical protein